MRIAVGSLQCESNTCSPIPTTREDFTVAYGEEMLQKVHVSDLLEEAGATVLPTLYAHALPGGPMQKDAFFWFVNRMVEAISDKRLDGIWLYLHGALYVQGLGSGEQYLLQCIREKVGYDVPIALALDFHANNSESICSLANIVCGFRTAPHVDQIETERKAMKLLLQCVKRKLLPSPRMVRPYVLIPGDALQTAISPLREIMQEADRLETLPGVLCAQVFGGQQWVDSPDTGPSIVVTHETDPSIAQRYAERLARLYWDARHDFTFLIETLEPKEALAAATNAKEKLVFISDSGDNTTAGAAGDNAFFLKLVQVSSAQNVLIAGITDSEAVRTCHEVPIGSTVQLQVGGTLSLASERSTIVGSVVHVGPILGYTGEESGRCATVDCGRFTVVITEKRTAFTREDIFQSIDLNVHQFRIVVVKLGYLFPDLARIADRSILAFTPGSSAERIADIGLQHIRRPMFPFEDHFLAFGEP